MLNATNNTIPMEWKIITLIRTIFLYIIYISCFFPPPPPVNTNMEKNEVTVNVQVPKQKTSASHRTHAPGSVGGWVVRCSGEDPEVARES